MIVNSKKIFISCIIGGGISIAFFNCVHESDFWRGITGEHNLVQYMLTCVSFVIFFGLFYILFHAAVFDKFYLVDILCAAACLGVLIFHYITWEQEVNVLAGKAGNYIWHRYPGLLVFAIVLGLTALYKIVTAHMSIDHGQATKILLLYYAVIIVLCGYLNYYPEYLTTDYYHGSAIFNSVYNVLHGIPYNEMSNSIYGNYAIILAIPMKILGMGEYFDFARLMGLFTSLTTMFAIYVIHNVIKNKAVRVLCVSVLPYQAVFSTSNYWQEYPLRTLCPLLLIAWVIFTDRHRKWSSKSRYRKVCMKLVTYMILTFSLVWNKESGVVCLIAYVSFLTLQYILYASKDVKLLLNGLLEMLLMMTSVAAALCIVSLYNLIVTWDTFFFPLFVNSYRDGLMLPLESGIWPWMGVVLLFLGMFTCMVLRAFYGTGLTPEESAYLLAAITGLGLMTYFMNRPAYGNMFICFFEAVICIGGCSELLMQGDGAGDLNKFVETMASMILIALIAGEVLQIENSLASNAYAGLNSYKKDFLELRDRIAREVEPDTYAFGIDIPELYSVLGWNNRSHTSGWGEIGDVYGDRVAALYTDLEREDTLMTTSSTMSRWPEVSEYLRTKYYIAKIYTYQNSVDSVKFYLMKRRPE